jgi:hypothetical protein
MFKVQRHEQTKTFSRRAIVNEGSDGDERAAGRKSIARRADVVHFLFEIPSVEDHAHRDDVGCRHGIFEKSSEAVQMRSLAPSLCAFARLAPQAEDQTTCNEDEPRGSSHGT